MVEFCKICPKCKKTYTNGAMGICGKCKIQLIEIKHSYTIIDNDVVTIVYSKFALSEKKIGCGKYFMYGAGEFICGGALHVNGKKKLCPNCEKFALSESKVPTHKEFQKAIDKSELRGYKFANQKQDEVKT